VRRKYRRPVVHVEPPPGYVDVLVVAPGVHVNGRAGVGARVDIVVPTPSLEINVGTGVLVHGKHKHRKHRKYKHRKYKHRKHKHRKHKHWR
jgi:hypothetical protein